VEQIKFVSVNGTEMAASMFAQMTGIDPDGEGIAPEINRVARDPKFGQERYWKGKRNSIISGCASPI
jgi:hypothetical protein